MRILVAGAFEAGSHWANAINTVKTAEGFARLGHQVTVLCRRPASGAHPPEQLALLYGLQSPLRWVQVSPAWWGRVLDGQWSFAFQGLLPLLTTWPDLVYSRSYVFPWLTASLGFATVAESHAHPDNATAAFRLYVRAAGKGRFRRWITISHRLVEHYQALGAPADKLAVVADAVDLDLFTPPAPLPPSPYAPDGPVLVYAGHLYDYKGIPTILEAARLLPGVRFHLVGGWPRDVAMQEERVRAMGLANVVFHGIKPHAEVPVYLWHADGLLLPPSGQHPSADWTSPVKLGEYLASGRPVVATAIPALMDWLSEREVWFTPPDNAPTLARTIRTLLANPGEARARTAAASRRAQEFSYTRRAARILELAR